MKPFYLIRLVAFAACILGIPVSAWCQVAIFNYTGSVQTYTVPAGVTCCSIDAWGATGGYVESTITDSGGNGGRVQCNLAVTPGEVLYIYIGGPGQPANGLNPLVYGGYNGGGSGGLWGGGGGGATDIRIGGSAFSNRVVVAGGGGGGGINSSFPDYERGGGGGGLIAENGYFANANTGTGGGQAGTQTSGGAGGIYTAGSGNSGSLDSGGNGNVGFYYSGGGGSGYYGGGGGSGSGGGGGSSYADTAITSYVTHTIGYNASGGGKIIFSLCDTSIALTVKPLNCSIVNIYPNPANNLLTINTPANDFNTYTLTNSMGHVLNQNELSGAVTNINIAFLPAGLYFVTLRGSNGSKALKFLKE